MDVGCAYVQTAETVDGQTVRRRHYFAMSDPQKNQATYLGKVPLDDPGYDITAGQAWRNPLGVAQGKVEAVSVPWTRGYDPALAKIREKAVSPMIEGRRILDLVAGRQQASQEHAANRTAIASALAKIGTGLGNFTAGK